MQNPLKKNSQEALKRSLFDNTTIEFLKTTVFLHNTTSDDRPVKFQLI